jgi:hypothetical protein
MEGAVKVRSLSIATAVFAVLVSVGNTSGLAWAQAGVEAQCRGATGRAYACCVKIVTRNPGIAQCDKEVAVFRCVGNKNSKYVSPHGCAMPKL